MGIDAEVDTSQGGDIIQTLKDEIFCSICCAIFEDPLKLDCCDGHLCKVCFEDVKGKFPTCPLCRASNFTAKPSRLMVSVLSTITLNCPAAECNEKLLYSYFKKHKETCVHLNMKTCERCNVKMELPEFERHSACFQSLLKNFEEIKKKHEATKKNYSYLTEKHTKTLAEKKELNQSLIRNQDIMRQLQLTIDQKSSQLQQLQYHNHMGGVQNHDLAIQNDNLKKTISDLNSKIGKLQRDLNSSNKKLKDDEKLNLKSINENLDKNKKLEAASKKQANRIKNMETEAKNLKQSLAQHKKISEQLKKDVENSKKALNVLAASKVSLAADFTDQQTKLHTLQSHYDHLSELFCQGDDTNNCKSCKTKVIDSLTSGKEEETKKETNTKIEKLQSEITRLNRVVTTQRQQQKSARKEIEKRTEEKIKQSYDSKIADLESALKTKNDLSSEFLETINSENSALKAEIIALENHIRSFDKPNDTKNNAFRTFDKYSQTDVEEPSYPASSDKDSEIRELNNQIARAEQSANLYLEMYEKERKVNQERANEKQGLFGLFKRK